ncbi:lipocalin-like domain-containing protein [Tenacibaculum retecalamus]|uniref:lipocalin family protein n=1 Tax=Tenacibaculum retecalamus TaxID=3018315 RepID=UPI0023D94803|nr:lipocalin family protein [Tenacibaculum retecalamus]WBX72000.1 lipocalin family protein [Tenacibaculum retecalamus]
MKNLLVLTVIITTLLSCSSSDDNISGNSIIGTWKMISHSDLSTFPECMKKTVIIFNSDNSLGGTSYEDCTGNNDLGEPFSGEYSKSDTNEYTLKFNNSSSRNIITAKVDNKSLVITDKGLSIRVTNWVKQ